MNPHIYDYLELAVITVAAAFYIWMNRGRSRFYAKVIHLLLASAGLLLLTGSLLVGVFNINSDLFGASGELLSYWFVFSLLSGYPVLLLTVIIDWRDRKNIVSTFCLTIMLVVLWFEQAHEWIITVLFLLYAMMVIYYYGYKNRFRE